MKLLHKLLHILESASPKLRKNLTILLSILLIFNAGIWALTFFFSYKYRLLLGLVTLAYGLGLRHAVDADHIATIDNATRKFMQEGKKPVFIGFSFSLGHSTVVIILSLLVAISASFVKNNLPDLAQTGALVGTLVSSLFLLFIGIVNLFALIDVFKMFKKVTKNQKYYEHEIQQYLHLTGFLAKIFNPLLKSIRHSWQMYPIGFLFGLGFDTASEVGLLSISAVTGASNTMPMWTILLLPLSFTAGMALIDSLDSVLMLGAYGWAYVKPMRKLYYNLNITLVSVIIALFIGGVEGLQILSKTLHLQSSFFQLVNGVDFSNFGYIIIGIFVLSWLISLAIYRIKNYDQLKAI